MATHPGGLITTAPPAVRTTRLVRRFGDRVVLKELDLTVAPGEFTALLGRSGSGKSTLLRAVARLDHTVEGSGELVVPERVSLSFQDSRLLPWLRVLDNVTLGLRGPGARERGLTALEEVGLVGGTAPGRTSSPVANNSAPHSPAPWSANPNSCWPTSRSGRSTP